MRRLLIPNSQTHLNTCHKKQFKKCTGCLRKVCSCKQKNFTPKYNLTTYPLRHDGNGKAFCENKEKCCDGKKLDYSCKNHGGNRINRQPKLPMTKCNCCPYALQQPKTTKNKDCCENQPRNRSYDGSGNNLKNPQWGAALTTLLRISYPDYGDGVSAMAIRGTSNPNPRIISNEVCKVHEDLGPSTQFSSFVWAWGQFLDHEIDLTPSGNSESANILTPQDDDYPGYTIPFFRSKFKFGTGTSVNSPREHLNDISSYIDASNVYGSTSERAYQLRLLDGSGKLKTSVSDNGEVILPLNTFGAHNDTPQGTNPSDFYFAGDIRANENLLLTSMHTLFVREHNRLCDVIVSENPQWIGQDETIYQLARKIVGAEEQWITFNEFLPILLGRTIGPYDGYDQYTNASISTEFSTFGFRLGHTLVSSELMLMSGEKIDLEDAFFDPSFIRQNGVNGLLGGAKLQPMENFDGKIIEQLRSFLFGGPDHQTHMLHDLAALNIQRGRDHGLPSYNDIREAYGLERYTDFSQINQNFEVVASLEELYGGDIDSIDPWVGAICENPKQGAMIGELLCAVLSDQFLRLRSGDMYWFEHDPYLSDEWTSRVKKMRLSSILLLNTSLGECPLDVFRLSQ